ncbi:hypothetical protein JOF53_001901 [Crossiella equi]|uniref:Secreted protein n=1 Tax=Crossiella equi TaxID=130796 RepID=A0ABS5A8X7_9PSEU|nr:lipase family protein [Crossiella equi]MBP2473029.1 hypothetical protein [Crossiella equi]
MFSGTRRRVLLPCLVIVALTALAPAASAEAAGLDTAHPERDLRSVLNAKGREVCDEVRESCHVRWTPPHDARRPVAGWCSRGVRVQLWESLVSEHISLAVTGAVAWLADRFAGRPAPGTCRSAS